MSNKWATALAVGAICISAAGGVYYFEGTPQYSLYELQQAVANHDLNGFNEYFDTKSVTDSLFDVMWGQVQKTASEAASDTSNPWEQAGTGLGMMMLEAMKPKIKEMASDAIESNVKKSLLHLDSQDPPPNFGLKDLKVSGKVATATITNQANGASLGVTLQQQPDRRWRIVGLDDQFVKELMAGLDDPGHNKEATGNVNTFRMALEQYSTDRNGDYPLPSVALGVLSRDSYLPGSQMLRNPWGDPRQSNLIDGSGVGGKLSLAHAVAMGHARLTPNGTVLGPGHEPRSNSYDLLTYGALVYDMDPATMTYVVYAIGKKDDKAIVAASVSNGGP